MSDLEKILVTSALTILGGVVVFVIGQLIAKLFIEPMQALKVVINDTRVALAFHAAIINTPISRTPETSDQASQALRKCSAELFAKASSIPSYDNIARMSCGYLPRQTKLNDAVRELRGLSTYVFEEGNKAMEQLEIIRKITERIERDLGLKPLP